VILAEDGFDALAKITDHQPDIIFVDIMMPRLGRVSDLRADQEKNTHFATHARGHAVFQRTACFDRARGPNGGLGRIPDQALHEG